MKTFDWNLARDYYIQDERVSYQDVAQHFGFAAITVRKRGAKEKWFSRRKRVIVRVNKKISEKMVNLIVKNMVKQYQFAPGWVTS